MTTTEVNQAVFEMTVAMVKDYAETRVGQGATTEQLNAELKSYVPRINAWSPRQRELMRLTVEMISADGMTVQ